MARILSIAFLAVLAVLSTGCTVVVKKPVLEVGFEMNTRRYLEAPDCTPSGSGSFTGNQGSSTLTYRCSRNFIYMGKFCTERWTERHTWVSGKDGGKDLPVRRTPSFSCQQ